MTTSGFRAPPAVGFQERGFPTIQFEDRGRIAEGDAAVHENPK